MNMQSPERVLFRQQQLPIFQNRTYSTEADAKACSKGDVVLVEDQVTGLVYNAAFQPDLMIYDAHYQNEQALSPQFQAHLDEVAEIIERGMGREAIVEVGCGKGFFLEKLLAKGFDVAGFDPAYEGANERVRKCYFTPDVSVIARGLVLRHVLEHIRNPFEFLSLLRDANGGGGRIYIEVPCFDWICRRRAWFDIFYEHVNYFRLSDFYRMFGSVVESGRLFGGQYIYVVAELASLRPPRGEGLDRVSFPEDFTYAVAASNQAATSRAAVWGGASKGVIFSLLKERAGTPVGMVIDINPAKQGRYLPATGLQVRSPREALAALPPGSTIYIMNSNYADEIKMMSGGKFQYVQVDHG